MLLGRLTGGNWTVISIVATREAEALARVHQALDEDQMSQSSQKE
jgi:hypothetical protein